MKTFIITLFITLFMPYSLFGMQKITLVHTNDLHSHLLGQSPNIDYTPLATGDDKTLGGWARIATIIKDVKQKRKQPVLVLDAGDFLMGSLFHMICRQEAVELRLMEKMGYDVVTLGNHEFDLMPDGLARIILAGEKHGPIPEIVFSNMITSQESRKDDLLEQVMEKGLIKRYLVLERKGIRIGLFGLMGKDAAEVSVFSKPVTFEDPVKAAKAMVALLRNKEKVDMVLCLSHSGLNEDPSKSEDEILAKEVPGIDVIISGHTHTKLSKPIIVNNTIVVQAWEYGKQVGILDLAFDDGNVRLSDYEVVDVDDSILGDAELHGAIETTIHHINNKVLKKHGLSFNSIIAETGFNLPIVEDECGLGNLISDSIRWHINKVDHDPSDPETRVALAIESYGLIRDDIIKGITGKIAVSDLFRAFPLGMGMDDSMGYPLVTFYLYGSEIKKGTEVLPSIYPLKGSDYFIQVSGIKFQYNPNRMIFDRVTDIQIESEKGVYRPLDYSKSNKELYKVAANLYIATFLKVVGNFTWGILNIIPKDREGKPIESLAEARVDADRAEPGIQELKEWVSLMAYVSRFADRNGNGIPDIPDKYRGKLGRIVKKPSWNPVSLLKNGNYLTFSALAILIFAVVLLLLISRLVWRLILKVK